MLMTTRSAKLASGFEHSTFTAEAFCRTARPLIVALGATCLLAAGPGSAEEVGATAHQSTVERECLDRHVAEGATMASVAGDFIRDYPEINSIDAIREFSIARDVSPYRVLAETTLLACLTQDGTAVEDIFVVKR